MPTKLSCYCKAKMLIGAVLLALTPISAKADLPLAITETQRVEAITDAFGLGCAVQARSTERAFAWASVAMATSAVLESKVSHDASSDFAGVFYSTQQGTQNKGGFNCKDVPEWPQK